MATVGDIITIIERIADTRLAESWDNCGLQIGDPHRSVKRILTSLDPLEDVIDYACKTQTDLLVTHHPLIFKPLKQIDLSSFSGRIIAKAYDHDLAIYSAHTNYDCAKGGLNDVFAQQLGLRETAPLGKPMAPDVMKLVIFVPLDHKEAIYQALGETTAGIIGHYTCCSFSSTGQGRYRPGDYAQPYSGVSGEVSCEDEIRVETVVSKRDAAKIVEHVAQVHPYETMAYDLYSLVSNGGHEGLGRIGRLAHAMPLSDFVHHVKSKLGDVIVKAAGDMTRMIKTVAVCTGSGSSMMGVFMKSPADVYVSGDLHYHDARMAEESNRAVIDVGHFASEIIMAEAMKDSLMTELCEKGFSIQVEACRVENDPFVYV